MLDAIIVILCFYSLTWLIKESAILSRPRQWVMEHSVFMAKMLYCWYCTGFYSGLIVYLVHETNFKFNYFVMWGLSGAAVSLILNVLVTRLSWEKSG